MELRLPSAGLDRERLEALVRTVSRFSCVVFVSQDGIEAPHFCLQIEPDGPAHPFLIFRLSRLGQLGRLRLEAGEEVRFIGYGREAAAALAAIQEAAREAAAPG